MGVELERDLFSSIDNIGKCQTRSDVLSVFFSSVADFGVTAVLITELPPPGSPLERFTLLNGWPPDWYDHYMKNEYYDCDEVAITARSVTEAYRWSDIAAKTPKGSATRRVADEARGVRLNDGIVVPIYGAHGDQYGVTMGGEQIDFREHSVQALQLLAIYSHHRAQLLSPRWPTLTDGSVEKLSNRESECLRWAANGKTNWEISQILGISRHTVDAHMRKSMAKLAAVTRTQAVAKALAARHIGL